VSFTGFLSRPRSEAIVAARKAGAIVQSKPGQLTDVLVRGRPNALQIAGTVGGLKLMEIRRLAARGHPVTVIGDGLFWRLVDSTPAPNKRKQVNGGKPVPRANGRTASGKPAPRANGRPVARRAGQSAVH
jgi:hypothetical protein